MNVSTDLFLEYKKRPERAALARLLERHQDAVYTLCYQVLRHPQDAEDACQEVLLEVSRQVDSVDGPEKFPAWLYRTAFHTALDVKRKRGRQRVRDAGATRGSGAPAEPPEASEALHRGLAGLDDSSRTLVVEHYFARRPLRELAAERGCSEVAVWKRIQSAKERLKKSLGSAAVSVLEGITTVPAPAGLLQKALGLSGGLAMAMKVGVKMAIVAPLLLLAGAGTVLLVRHSDPPVPRSLEPRPPASPPSARRMPPQLIPPIAAAAPAPPPVAAPRVRKPYPFKDPTVGQPAAAVRTWTILSSTRVTLDCQNEPLPALLKTISEMTGLTLVPAAGFEREMISFKVQSIVVDGALRLLLQPRNKGYEILPDGTIRIDVQENLQGGYEKAAQQAAALVQELQQVREEMNGGWDGVARTDYGAKVDAMLGTKRIVSTQGETTLEREFQRLHELGVYVQVQARTTGVDGRTRRQEVLRKPFLQVVAERSLDDHLQELARAHGLVAVPINGQVVFTNEDHAAVYRAQAEQPRREHERLLAALQKPVELSGAAEVSDFLDAVGRSHGLSVVPSEAAWNSPVTLSPPAGTTLRQALDQLKVHGFRWAVRDGKLYVVK